jgi:hypothetical protein
MVKLVLLKSCIPGRTFDYFRSNGYDIVDAIEIQGDIQIPRGSLESIVKTTKISRLKTREPNE